MRHALLAAAVACIAVAPPSADASPVRSNHDRTAAHTHRAVLHRSSPTHAAKRFGAARGTTRFATGMVVGRDPETGRATLPEPQSFRPLTIDELQGLAHHEAEGLVTIKNADGSETLNHQGRFADFALVRRGRNGKPVFECVEGEGQVKHALDKARPLPPGREER